MEQNTPKSEPLTFAVDPSACRRAVRSDGWTVDKQVGFLRMLATTQNVAAAARSVGMGRQSAYKLRARLDETPFGAAWRMALDSARDTLVEAAIDRAVNGVEVPHFWKGELIGTSRRFDERLTTALLTSGALQRSRQAVGPEREFAHRDLSRLLLRIEHGPSEWCDFEDEQDFAWGDSPYADESADPPRDVDTDEEEDSFEEDEDACDDDEQGADDECGGFDDYGSTAQNPVKGGTESGARDEGGK